jgi:hypothetical protein
VRHDRASRSSTNWAEKAGIFAAAFLLRWLLRREAGSPAALPAQRKRKRALVASPPPAADPALLLQIARVGSLINQVDRSANECLRNGSTLNLVQVLVVLLIIRHQSELLARPSLDIPTKETLQ